MRFNTKLSQAAIDAIEASPELFDQTSWFSTREECGTAHCWYGWCLILEGYDFRELSFNSEVLALATTTIGLHPYGKKFRRITDGSNTIEDIKFYHAKLAKGESIEFDRFGYDSNGFNEAGYNFEGWDTLGYDRDGYNENGMTREGKLAEADYCRAEYYRSALKSDRRMVRSHQTIVD